MNLEAQHVRCTCNGQRRMVRATVRIRKGGKVIEERTYEHPCLCTSQLLGMFPNYVSPPGE